MIGFWLGVALLLGLALAFLLPVLWRPKPTPGTANADGANVAVYRDQLREAERDLAADVITPERHEQLRAEVQRRVLEDTALAAAPLAPAQPARRTVWALLLLLPLASVATYLTLGRPDAVGPLAARAPAVDPSQVTPEQVEAMVSALAERMKADPGKVEGWQMLGRSYAALGRHADAAAALRKAAELLPGNPDVLADLADAVAMSQDRSLAGEPTRLIQQALAVDPGHGKALALAGSAAFEARNFAAARGYWERLVAQLPADAEVTQSIRASIAEALQLEGAASAPAGVAAAAARTAGAASAAATPAAAAASAATPATLSGEVVLSPELAGRVAAGDTVFVFARAAQGSRMPLAILRQPAAAWPLRFKLDDASAMSPAAKLSGANSVVVMARISKSGNATPQPGDLFGQSAAVAPGASGLRIVIDQVQP